VNHRVSNQHHNGVDRVTRTNSSVLLEEFSVTSGCVTFAFVVVGDSLIILDLNILSNPANNLSKQNGMKQMMNVIDEYPMNIIAMLNAL